MPRRHGPGCTAWRAPEPAAEPAVARPAGDRVVAAAARQDVVAVIAHQLVVAGIAGHHVVGRSAVELVGAEPADQQVLVFIAPAGETGRAGEEASTCRYLRGSKCMMTGTAPSGAGNSE
jgi:hypothetical protein